MEAKKRLTFYTNSETLQEGYIRLKDKSWSSDILYFSVNPNVPL